MALTVHSTPVAITTKEGSRHPHPSTGIHGGQHYWIDPEALPRPKDEEPNSRHIRQRLARQGARCRGRSTRVFLSTWKRDHSRARTSCVVCSVQAQCLAYALQTGPHPGTWGGTDAATRADLTAQLAGSPSRVHDKQFGDAAVLEVVAAHGLSIGGDA